MSYHYARLGNSCEPITSAIPSNTKFFPPNDPVYSKFYTTMLTYPGQYSDFATNEDEQKRFLKGNKIPIEHNSYEGKNAMPEIFNVENQGCKSCSSK